MFLPLKFWSLPPTLRNSDHDRVFLLLNYGVGLTREFSMATQNRLAEWFVEDYMRVMECTEHEDHRKTASNVTWRYYQINTSHTITSRPRWNRESSCFYINQVQRSKKMWKCKKPLFYSIIVFREKVRWSHAKLFSPFIQWFSSITRCSTRSGHSVIQLMSFEHNPFQFLQVSGTSNFINYLFLQK